MVQSIRVHSPTLNKVFAFAIALIDWIAEQMGHASGNTVRQQYGAWINEGGSDVVARLQLTRNFAWSPLYTETRKSDDFGKPANDRNIPFRQF